MNLQTGKIILLTALTCISLNSMAKSENIPSIGTSSANNIQIQPGSWDMNMIYRPSQKQLKRESQGYINIYDGFKDSQVEAILDEKFNRIENMMFTRVKVTDDYGQVLTDPQTGEEIVANDGCDD